MSKTITTGSYLTLLELGEGNTFAESLLLSGLATALMDVMAITESLMIFLNIKRMLDESMDCLVNHHRLYVNLLRIVACKIWI